MIEIITLIVVIMIAALVADYYKQQQMYKLRQELDETKRLLEELYKLPSSDQSWIGQYLDRREAEEFPKKKVPKWRKLKARLEAKNEV